MKRAAVALALLAVAGVAVAATRRQVAPTFEPQDLFSGVVQGAVDVAGDLAEWTEQNLVEVNMNSQPVGAFQVGMSSQIAAMLATIRWAEGTARTGDPYRVCYGYSHRIQSFTDHPVITGEWAGETLPDGMCEAAGLGPGCVSTAAGAYQIIRPTWKRLKAKLSLPDFSPASQDAAATELLRERGALAKLAEGDFQGAIVAARREWASLPGAGYAQPERSMDALLAQFRAAGGVTA